MCGVIMDTIKKIDKRFALFFKLQKKEIKKRFDKVGLYPGQPMMLRLIGNNPGTTQSFVAESLHITPASVAISTKRLEKQGYIVKRCDENNLRANMLYLTKEGKEVVSYIDREFEHIMKLVYKDIGEEEGLVLIRLLNKLLINLSGLEKDNDNLEDSELCELFMKLNEEEQKEC